MAKELRQRKTGAGKEQGKAKAKTSAAPAAAPAPTGSKPWQNYFFYVVISILLIPSILSFSYYGPNFFLPDALTRLRFSPEEWQYMLRNRTVVMIGGPHRGGTSVLWESIRAHQQVTDFGSTFESGADHSEGLFCQNVYPRFGIGQEFTRGKKWKATGLGRYALGPEADVHWTEDHEYATPERQAQLLNELGRHWDLTDKPVLLEKSPPNIVLSTFLQGVMNIGNGGWESVPPAFGGASSVVRFVFISRHPLPNSYAHKRMGANQNDLLSKLIENWIAIHKYLDVDLPRLQHARVLRLEDFAKEPEAHLNDIWAWLGLTANPELAIQMAKGIDSDPNKKHRVTHCESLQDSFERDSFKIMCDELNPIVKAIQSVSYDLADDEWMCTA